MAFGTFDVIIDGEQIGGLPETAARLTVKANTGTLKDASGDKFKFPRPPASVTLPYTLTLDTDVAAGAGVNSETIGYTVLVTTSSGGSVNTTFAARPAGDVIALTDLVESVVIPVSDTIAARDEAVAAKDSAEVAATTAAASATSAAASATLAAAPTDTLVAAKINDPASATNAALSATIVNQASPWGLRGNRAVFLGDSNTFGYNQSGENYPDACVVSSKGRIIKVRNSGVSGDTIAQIAVRVQSQVIDLNPNICFVMAGTNTLNTDVPDLPTAKTAYRDTIIEPLRAAGILPVICSVLPNGNSIWRNGTVVQFNVWLRNLAASYGLPYVDFYSAVIDSTTGGWAAAYSADTLHANAAGYRLMGKIAADAMNAYLAANGAPLTYDNADVLNKWDNGCFINDTNADSIPDNFSIALGTSTGLTYSVAPRGGYKGKAWALTLTNPNGDLSRGLTRTVSSTGSRFVPGDKLALGCKYDVTTGTMPAGAGFTFEIVWTGGTGGTETLIKTGVDVTEGIAYSEVTVPAGATAVEVRMKFTGEAAATRQFALGQATVYNLTQQAALV